jgi:hypothetical protein
VSEWLLDENGDVAAEVNDTGGIMLLDTSDIRSIRILKGTIDES